MINVEIPVEGNFLLTGSRALGTRIAKDIDFICYSHQLEGDDWHFDKNMLSASKDNYDVILADNHPSLQRLLESCGLDYCYRNIGALFALKRSHIHLPRKNWFSDIQDYTFLRQMFYESVPFDFNRTQCIPWFLEISDQFKKELDEINRTHTMSLNVTKDEFFDDGVKKYIDHDILHEMFAHGTLPVYKRTQKPGSEVFCSKDLWDMLSFNDKVLMVLEETYVIAAERTIIPTFYANHMECRGLEATYNGLNQKMHMQTVLNALKKVCTTLSSGWFREFSIDNYFEICNNIDMNYFKNVCTKIHEDGIIYK